MRALEAALLGLAALCVALAAVAWSNAPAFSSQAVAAALIPAGFCAATWLFEHRRTLDEFARRMDRRLAQEGALLTAFELERRGARDAFGALLAQRVLRDLPARALRIASAPPSLAFLAAPLIAGAVLAAAMERAPARGPGGDLDALLQALVTAQSASIGAPSSESQDPAAAATFARAVARVEALGQAPDPAQRERALTEVEAELAKLIERAPGSELAQRAEIARSLAEEARGKSQGAAEGRRPFSDRERLQNGATDRTMSGSTSAAGASGQAAGTPATAPATLTPGLRPASAPPVAEAGTLAGRFWPARYDAVVAAWIEAQRAREQR